jgi:hypothetical protein
MESISYYMQTVGHETPKTVRPDVNNRLLATYHM